MGNKQDRCLEQQICYVGRQFNECFVRGNFSVVSGA